MLAEEFRASHEDTIKQRNAEKAIAKFNTMVNICRITILHENRTLDTPRVVCPAEK